MRTGDCVWCKRPLTAQAGMRRFKEGDGTNDAACFPAIPAFAGFVSSGRAKNLFAYGALARKAFRRMRTCCTVFSVNRRSIFFHTLW